MSNTTTGMSNPRKTALAFLATFETLDLETNLSLRTDGCRHDLAPSSMGYPSPKTNEQFAKHFKFIQQVIKSFPVTPKEVFESETQNSTQVTVWATSTATFRDEVKDDDGSVDWTYLGEYMFIFFIDRTGSKIERIIEFIDSQRVMGIQGLIKRAMENLEKTKERT